MDSNDIFTPEEFAHARLFRTLHQQMRDFFAEVDALVSKIPRSLTNIGDRLLGGQMIIALKAILADCRATDILLSAGYPLAAASVVSSLWEKSVIARYVLACPASRLSAYMQQGSKRKLPWNMKAMLAELVSDHIPAGSTPQLETEKWYLHYMLLCSIKHPQAASLAFAAQIHTDMASPSKLRPASPNVADGLAAVIGSLALGSTLDFLKSYAGAFCDAEFAHCVGTTNAAFWSFCLSTYPVSEEVLPPMLQMLPGDVSPELVEWLRQRFGGSNGTVLPGPSED